MNDLDVKLIKASDVLGIVDQEKIVDWANEYLTDPVDQDLLDLALCDAKDEQCILHAKHRLYKKAGVEHMDRIDALDYYSQVLCRQISDGSIEPLVGASLIAKAAITNGVEGYTRVDPFIYIHSEVNDRPSEQDFFSKAAKEEAKIFIQDLP